MDCSGSETTCEVWYRGFPDSPAVRTPHLTAEGMGLIPGQTKGTKIPQSHNAAKK